MIKEDYVSFETAKLLKEKGFDEPSKFWYDNNGVISQKYIDVIDRPLGKDTHYPCVTISFAMKWLRGKGIIITIVYMRYSLQTIGSQMMFGFNIQNVQGELLFENIDVAYDSYEQAEKDAIKYSLENLI